MFLSQWKTLLIGKDHCVTVYNMRMQQPCSFFHGHILFLSVSVSCWALTRQPFWYCRICSKSNCRRDLLLIPSPPTRCVAGCNPTLRQTAYNGRPIIPSILLLYVGWGGGERGGWVSSPIRICPAKACAINTCCHSERYERGGGQNPPTPM